MDANLILQPLLGRRNQPVHLRVHVEHGFDGGEGPVRRAEQRAKIVGARGDRRIERIFVERQLAVALELHAGFSQPRQHAGTVRADERRPQRVVQLAEDRLAADAGRVAAAGRRALFAGELDELVVGRDKRLNLVLDGRGVGSQVDGDDGCRVFSSPPSAVTPSTTFSNVFELDVAAMLLMRIAASDAVTALSAAVSPEIPLLSVSTKLHRPRQVVHDR
jgi:hypothetical protein